MATAAAAGCRKLQPAAMEHSVSPRPPAPPFCATCKKPSKTVCISIDSQLWSSRAAQQRPTAVPERQWALVGVTFSKNGPWSVSIVSINIGSRSSGLVQCWGKISFCFIDRLTAVATTVIVTAAVTVLVTAAVIITVTVTVTVSATAVAATVPATVAVSVSVPGTAPCSCCFRHSFS